MSDVNIRGAINEAEKELKEYSSALHDGDMQRVSATYVKNTGRNLGMLTLFKLPFLIPVILVILVIVIIFYMCYDFLFGFSFKMEQELAELNEEGYYTTINESNYGEKDYYFYQDPLENVYVYYKDWNNREKVLLYDAFLKEAYGIYLLIEGTDIDISDGDTILLDNSDVDRILDTIIEAEKKREEFAKKTFEWVYKIYDYTYSEQEVYDEETGSWHTETVKSDSPEWQPDDVWDDTEMSHWHTSKGSVTLYRNDIEGEIDPVDNTPRFMVHWQPVMAICQMTSSQDYSDWGATGDVSNPELGKKEYGDMDGYYLTDATVERIVDELSYDFEFYYDGSERERDYKYKEMEDIAYTLEVREMSEVSSAPDTAYIKKTPATAPKTISNLYEEYLYNYEPVEDGYGSYICVGRSKRIDAVAFVDFMKELCSQFDFDEFIETIEHFPSAEGDVARFERLKAIYEWQLETGQPYFVEEDNFPCFSNGVRLGTDVGLEEDDFFVPEWDDFEGDNYLEGDFDYVWVDGGWYAISEAARVDLSVSDNLSKAEITELMTWFSLQYGNPKGASFYDAVDALYNWQQSTGCSLTGIMGIWIQEGALRGTIGRDHWNFGNMTASSGDPYFYVKGSSYKWCDFREKYNGDLGAAMTDQLSRISRNYIGKGQNTLFAMSWNTVYGIYSAQSPEEECPISAFTHCYCPYWDDVSFAVSSEKVPNPAYKGWANNCGKYMQQMRSYIGR